MAAAGTAVWDSHIVARGRSMTPDELNQLIAHMPEGRRMTILVIENTTVAGTDTETTTGGVTASTGGPYPATRIPPVAASPLEVAKEALRDTPAVRRTPAEWSNAFNGAIAVRELKRALSAAVLEHEERGEGRGHGALVITPAAMVAYLKTRHELITSRGKRPAWFARVVLGATHAS